MAAYPNLANYEFPQDSCPPYDETEDSSTDDEDCSETAFEGFMYDDHGELVPVSSDSPSAPVAPSAPVNEPPSSSPSTEMPRPPSTNATFNSGKKQIKLTKDANGKFGIKFTRMGPRMFLSYVEQNSNAAKCGLGFGDQILEVRGLDISRMSGSTLMSTLSNSSVREVQCTVWMRPYDFNMQGFVDSNFDLHYKTVLGKSLGTVKVTRVAKSGFIKNLKLLAVNDESVFVCKESQLMSIFYRNVGKSIRLRVMPASLYLHLMRKQDKNRAKNLMQLSPRIL